ncbi:MAG: hypothetical protein JXB10_11845 [Pirellulales bacterium]|nr:hypothetical protein [Pirellulales bacterium]
MRRHVLGILALLSLLGAVCLWLWPQGPGAAPWEAGCWRISILLSVIWLAYPNIRRLSPWFWLLFPVLLLLLVWRPRWFLFLIPLLLLIAMLRPRMKDHALRPPRDG